VSWTTLTGAGGIVVHDGRLLLVRQRRAYGVHWEFPSGYYEPGESFEETTAREVLEDFPEGLDYLITGVGTGGHITAVSELLKERFPSLKTFAVEPTKSAVISGGQPSPHKIQGIGAGFIPANLHTATLDGTIQVTEEEAFEYARRAAREEGLFVGPSSGGALAAVARKIPEMAEGARVLTFCFDTGERYLSVEGLF
jgi:cysteine synthase A